MKIACFNSEPVLLAVLLVLAISVAWMTAQRKEGFDVSHRSYQDLYASPDNLQVSGLDLRKSRGDDSSIDLVVSLSQSGSAISEQEDVNVQEGRHPQDLVFAGERTDSAFWTLWGENLPRVVIGNPNVYFGVSPFTIDDFVLPSTHYSKFVQESAARILREEFNVALEDAPSEKIEKISVGVHRALYPHRGVPRKFMRRLNGLQQYEAAVSGRSEVYCANQSEIYAFFANMAGVPTRIVDVGGLYGDVALGAHSFTESFDRATSRWRYVDLQMSIGGVRTSSGEYVNAVQLLHRIEARQTQDLLVDELSLDGATSMSYAERSEKVEHFLHPQVTLVYLWASIDRFHPLARFQRLLLTPRLAYSLRTVDFGVHIRIVCSWLLIIGLCCWISIRGRHQFGLCCCPRLSDGR